MFRKALACKNPLSINSRKFTSGRTLAYYALGPGFIQYCSNKTEQKKGNSRFE
jgi:hypothetical protein